jgi:hypothetical protein
MYIAAREENEKTPPFNTLTTKTRKSSKKKKKPNASSAIVCALSVSNFPDSVVELSCSSIF